MFNYSISVEVLSVPLMVFPANRYPRRKAKQKWTIQKGDILGAMREPMEAVIIKVYSVTETQPVALYKSV